MQIAICDDEPAETAYLSALVERWAAARGETVRLRAYPSAESFLFDYEGDASADILLLDIQMEGMDGVSLAKKIRSGNERVQIAFITGFGDFMAEGYEVCALHYLLKPVMAEKLFGVLDRAAKNLEGAAPSLLLAASDGAAVRVFLREIVYVEVFDHLLEIETVKGRIGVKMPLAALEKELTGAFVRCHRCYLVHLRYIRKITKEAVVLDSGRELPLSRRSYAQVNRAMLRYLTGEGQ